MPFLYILIMANITKKQIISCIILFTILILITGCNQPKLEDYIKEPYEYLIYNHEDFSIKYPEWPEAEKGDAEIAVSRGYCSLIINTMEATNANSLHDQMVDAIKISPQVISHDEDSNKLLIKSVSTYQEHKLVSQMKLVGCNNNAHVINIACLEELVGYPEILSFYNDVMDSIECNKVDDDNKDDKKETEIETPKEEPTTYETFEQEDFQIQSPEWAEMDDMGTDTVFGVSKGSASVIVNKHNALPKDLFNWITSNLEDNEGHKLLSAKPINNDESEYEYKYSLPYGEYTLIAESRIFYCNYQSYAPVVVYIESLADEETEKIKEKVLDSAVCKKTYTIPEPEIPEEIIEEQPEIIEEIKDEIIKTDIGNEYGLDAEAIVYFINTNPFFTKVMADFPKANLVLADPAGNVELKITLDNNGKITLIENGLHEEYDVTLYVSLRDAINILNNAANINPITLLKFAVSVTTDPIEIKQQVIEKVLKGEYK